MGLEGSWTHLPTGQWHCSWRLETTTAGSLTVTSVTVARISDASFTAQRSVTFSSTADGSVTEVFDWPPKLFIVAHTSETLDGRLTVGSVGSSSGGSPFFTEICNTPPCFDPMTN